MKAWASYGSEHSANLVMIGRFRDAASAEKAKAIIDELTEFIRASDEDQRTAERYSEGLIEILKRINFYDVAPAELEQFRYDVSFELKDNQIIVTTDETDISACLKLMIYKGARVEVYSAHDYPDFGEKSGQ